MPGHGSRRDHPRSRGHDKESDGQRVMETWCGPHLDRGKRVPGVRMVDGTWMCQECFDGKAVSVSECKGIGRGKLDILDSIDRLGDKVERLYGELADTKQLLMTVLKKRPDQVQGQQPQPIARIIYEVEQEFGWPFQMLQAPSNERRFAEARMVFVYLMRTRTDYSFPQLGHMLNRHHTTVLDAYRRCRYLLSTDGGISVRANNIERRLDKEPEKVSA